MENPGKLFVRVDYILLRQDQQVDWQIEEAFQIITMPARVDGRTQWLSDHKGFYTRVKVLHR